MQEKILKNFNLPPEYLNNLEKKRKSQNNEEPKGYYDKIFSRHEKNKANDTSDTRSDKSSGSKKIYE